jgi:hypothetical protein
MEGIINLSVYWTKVYCLVLTLVALNLLSLVEQIRQFSLHRYIFLSKCIKKRALLQYPPTKVIEKFYCGWKNEDRWWEMCLYFSIATRSFLTNSSYFSNHNEISLKKLYPHQLFMETNPQRYGTLEKIKLWYFFFSNYISFNFVLSRAGLTFTMF